MPVNPHIKGGPDVPVVDGGTGASDAATGLTNLGGLDATAHLSINHAGIPGVGDLTVAAHSTTDHTGITGVGIGKLVNRTSLQDGTFTSGTTVTPLDDTIPTSGEGNLFMTAPAHTPLDAANILEIEVVVNLAHTAAGALTAALFDGGASAIAVGSQRQATAPFDAEPVQVSFRHIQVAGTTSPITFSVRCGSDAAGTTSFNGISSGRLFGGVFASTIQIKEYTP